MFAGLRGGIYGLKQAANIWYEKLRNVLKYYDFSQSREDQCLFTKKMKDDTLYLIVHVDDFLIAAEKEENVDKVAVYLKTNFELIDLGNISKYLGINIRKNSEGYFCMNQSDYIKNILTRFGLQEAKPSNIPMDTGYQKHRKETPLMQNNEKYQQLIGTLLYLSVNTRPDIAASVSIMSQFNRCPTEMDWTEVKRICRYLKGTINYELVLGGHNAEEKNLVGYSDADWASTKVDRKSNSGYVFKLWNSTISWGCRKQASVSLSSTEAEYHALADAVQEGMWVNRLLNDFKINTQSKFRIYEDNQSCLKIIENNKFIERSI